MFVPLKVTFVAPAMYPDIEFVRSIQTWSGTLSCALVAPAWAATPMPPITSNPTRRPARASALVSDPRIFTYDACTESPPSTRT